MNPVKLGVIGCGVIGRHHIAAAAELPHVDLVAIADLRTDLAQELADQHGVPTVYAAADELLAEDNIEAVVLALPAVFRADLALKAFAANKHVLTEKPVARNVGEVQQLLAARGDRVAACCSARYHALRATKAVTDFIATGALGNLRIIRCRAIRAAGPPPTSPPPNWRLSYELNGGGIMSNWGCYDLDYFLGITGWTLEPQTVLAQTWTVPTPYASHVTPNSDAETHISAFIRCRQATNPAGVTITYERGEYVAAEPAQAWQIIGEQGSLRLHMTNSAEKRIVFTAASTEAGVTEEVIWAGDDMGESVHPFPVSNFARAIQTGEEPQTSLERALVIQQITDAIYASSRRGEAVAIQ